MNQSRLRRPLRTRPLPAEFPGLHYMDELEKDAVVRVLERKSPYRYAGLGARGEVDEFEREFAAFLGVPFCLGVTSGTMALHTALAALGVGPGQEIIIPAYLWISVAAAITNLGAVPILADIDDTFCIDPASVETQITPRTSGIIAVHMNGGMADVHALSSLARNHHLFLLEDCAQCVGGTLNGQPLGSFGDISTFSFQINKNMTSGEAGCIATRNYDLYRRAAACHDTGYVRSPDGQFLMASTHGLWGFGCRLDEIRAAILRVQLNRLGAVLTHMRNSKRRINEAIRKLPGLGFRRLLDPDGDTGGFLILILETSDAADIVCNTLRTNNIVSPSPDSSAVILANYGFHIYSNIPGLLDRSSLNKRGTPWTLI